MSLLGVISDEPLHVRADVANGSGWGCIVQNAADTWRLSAFRGGKGAVAARPSSEGWVMFSSEMTVVPVQRQIRSDVVIAAISPVGREPFARLGTPWAFAFEGSIDDVDALQAALDPSWAASPALRTAGDLMFVHVFTYMAGVGALYASDIALAHASRDIWRARGLGSASFLCSNGDRLYAYAAGLPLMLTHLPGAIVVGSPDMVPEGSGARSLPGGTVASISRRPHLSWSARRVVDG